MIVFEGSFGWLGIILQSFLVLAMLCLLLRSMYSLYPALRVRVVARSIVALRMLQLRPRFYDLNTSHRIYKMIGIVRPPCSAAILWL